MNTVKWLLRILLIFLLSHFSFSADTITQHHFIKDNNNEVIVSGGKIFALGFFSPGSSRNRYVGIWYYQIPGKTVVWVANRDNPVKDTSGILRIDGRGNLVLFQGNQTLPVWSTNISIAGARNSYAQILDSGNLVLIHNDTRKAVLWQSFGYPTNTWLSFMKIGFNLRTGLNQAYTSWKSPDDPGVGNYSFRMNPGVSPQMVFYKGSVPLWRSGTWTGQRWSGIPQMTNNFIFNDSFVNTDDEVSFSSDAKNASIITRWVTNETGVVQRIIWNNKARRWIFLPIPKEQCDFYGHCGPNGYCNPYLGDFECTCFPGFEPKSHEAWIVRDRTGGCVRKRDVSMCGNGEGFVKFPHVKVPDTSAHALVDMSIGLKQCEEKCLRNCSCMAYASANSETNGGVGCLTWHGDLMDARAYTETGQDLFIRVDKNDLARYTKKGLIQKKGVLAAIIISSAIVFLILVAFLRCLVRRKRREARTRTNKNIFSFTTRTSLYFEDSLGEKETDESGRNGDLPFFSLRTIAVATNNFSSDNKLGQGGFGPVYKGVLLNGKEIAVKRLSKHSGQGVQEFKNEILLIAKLQHRNLVRMLGCCIEGEEKMLIYELLPNKSLDSIIFDESKISMLDWKKRFEIICGIARGMLYLHQDSRLRIIHRDLKASNVLLDATMNPKISDFSMARIFGEDQTEGDTKRVVGTYGYMSPEYAMQGHFSIKSDVYSFGVLLLEIITGKRISSYFPDSPSLNLVGHVWELWKEDKAMEVVDPALGDSYSTDEILNCIQIGLLCVQEHATHRPTMAVVVSMLSNEATLPSPEQPAFIEKKSHNGDGLSGVKESILKMMCRSL
ncbi:G-type lectin S-receptor-like serine/threonine-protein kinase RKS1 isoform X1 [Hibiscus syriacus]|uniref:G-type lectin S-receptor-like serine/threonine-protein kinase RKS1 isoform X1 n=1 Tax=Hibiscus syriacus TaxID=106335 RepID=UPI00192407E3|nr:G-type lectin S-receptor-like serine/threonine-protein kinase RKS1 isoform X1 [Hibiscus syriacus]